MRARGRLLPLFGFALLLIAIAGFAGPPMEGPRPSRGSAAVLDEPGLLTELPIASALATREAPRSIAELRERIAAVLEREAVPGVGLALVDRQGVIWAGGVGVADLETRRPIDADTQFRAASITKSFVALGIMRLVEQGRLDLDQPLRELMPEIELGNRWAAEAPIRLSHALEHTAGFDDMRFNELWTEGELSPRAALAINPRSRTARWRPGSRMAYSNVGFTIGGHAIERASGEAWDRHLQRELLEPLGMPTARFRRTSAFADRLATGYARPGEAAPFRSLAHAPAGSLLASPRELGRLVLFWLRRGELDGRRLVSPAGLARIEATQTLPYPATDANFGLGNYGDVMHPVRSRGHDGGLPGFLSAYRYFPELGLGYVVLLNASHSARAYVDVRALVFAYLTRDRALPRPPTAPLDPDAIAPALGYYGYANPRVELLGFVERALIGVRLGSSDEGVELELLRGGTIELIPTGDGGFRLPGEGGTSIRLTTDADGRRILVASFAYFEAGSYTWARARLLGLRAAIALMQLSLIWLLCWALVAGFRRARGHAPTQGALALHAWPAVASLAFAAMPFLASLIVQRDAWASANPLSVGLFVASLAFAGCSAAAMATAVRANLRGTGHWAARVVPSAASIACFAMAIWLAANHVIGLRIWLW